jgi:hypothetical protein
VQVADAQCTEHQNLGADPGLPERRAFFDVRARQQVRAGVFERPGDLSGTVPVCVRLDDGKLLWEARSG